MWNRHRLISVCMDWFLLALCSAIFSALASVFEKKSLFTLTALEFSFFISVFVFVFSIPFLFTINYNAIIPVHMAILFVKTALASASFFFVMNGIKRMELSGSLPLMVLTPGLVALSAFFILGESLSFSQIAGMVVLLGGTVFLQWSVTSVNQLNVWSFFKIAGNRYMLAALLIYTVTALLDKALLSTWKVPMDQFMGIQHFFQLVIFGSFYVGWKKTENWKPKLKQVWIFLILIALFTIVYRYTQFLAMREGSVALVLTIKRISVFFAILMAGKMFHEHKLWQRSLATLILLFGAFLIVWKF